MVLTTNLLNEIRDAVQTELKNNQLTHGAIGTDNTTPTAGDTALGSEVFIDAADEYDVTVANKLTASLRVLTTEANGNTIVEVGWFDAASGGDMKTHDLVNSIDKTSDIQLYIDSEITITVTES